MNYHRTDKRSPSQQRTYTLTSYKTSTLLSATNTCILFTHTKTLSKPYPDRPHEGILKITTNKKHIQRVLESVVKLTADLESMSVGPSQVHCLSIDVGVLESDGGLLRFCLEGVKKVLEREGVRMCYGVGAFERVLVGDCWVEDPSEEEEGVSVGRCVEVRGDGYIFYHERI